MRGTWDVFGMHFTTSNDPELCLLLVYEVEQG